MLSALLMSSLSCCLLLSLVPNALGHGYVSSPRSRNWVAYQDGLDWGSKAGVPMREYCPHCLNRNDVVCGKSPSFSYDKWLDSVGNPMPWVSQGTALTQGGILRVHITITAHHYGHFELKACPNGRSSTQDCFDKHPLVFVRDDLYGLPADPGHPERGYLAPPPNSEFDMDYQLPSDLIGDQVLLQWKYITANSCNPPGYHEYFNGANSQSKVLPDTYWKSDLSDCTTPYPQDGTTGAGWPEQFFNCVEVTIKGGVAGLPTAPVPPAPSHVIRTPSPTTKPTPPPLSVAPPPVGVPTSVTDRTAKPTIKPTSKPTRTPTTKPTLNSITPPTTKPTMKPTQEPTTKPTITPTITPTMGNSNVKSAPTGTGCCSQDYKSCIDWCGTTLESCSVCSSACTYWMLSGSLANSTCTPRWGTCGADLDPCCPGLVCQYENDWYSQCVPETC